MTIKLTGSFLRKKESESAEVPRKDFLDKQSGMKMHSRLGEANTPRDQRQAGSFLFSKQP